MSESYKEVRFDVYCPKCRYKDTPETHDPCNECLDEGMNVESEKPVCFEEKD